MKRSANGEPGILWQNIALLLIVIVIALAAACIGRL
jgi:hypothetical protein